MTLPNQRRAPGRGLGFGVVPAVLPEISASVLDLDAVRQPVNIVSWKRSFDRQPGRLGSVKGQEENGDI